MRKKYDINDHVRRVTYDLVAPVVLNIRRVLANRYDIHEGKNANYNDLCDEASAEFLREMKLYCDVYRLPFEGHIVHGEIAHTPLSPSKFWGTEHTWCHVVVDGVDLYVDPTSGQFRRCFLRIPDFIISTKKIKYFVTDHDSIVAWAYSTRNERIVDVVTFMVYKVWGRISDVINLFYRRKTRWI